MLSALFERRIDSIHSVLGARQLFFVAGAPKSGTTWLQKALNAHSQIVCAGEGHFADSFSPKLLELMQDYYKQQRVVVDNVYEGESQFRHEPQEELDFLSASFILSTLSRLDITEETVLIGDKTPASIDYLKFLHRLFPDAKYINIVRDGRDTLASLNKHAERVFRMDGKDIDVDAFVLENTKMYVGRWKRSLNKAEVFDAANPGLLRTVRYEDLKHDFSASFADVLNFLGVDASPAQVARCEEETSFKKMSGGREAGEENPDSFVRKGIVGDWRNNVAPEQLEIFNSLASDWLVKLGYED